MPTPLYSDNPIAQGLLIKQLERYNLNVTATENGIEAITGECRPLSSVSLLLILLPEWESHEPGYFSVAFFDHRKLYNLTLSFLTTYNL
jgi:hypothetical protein